MSIGDSYASGYRPTGPGAGGPSRESFVYQVGDKLSDNQPDFRVMSQGIEIGAGWQRIGQTSGKEYISLSISAPEFGKTLYANLGRAAGQSDPNAFALIWTPQD